MSTQIDIISVYASPCCPMSKKPQQFKAGGHVFVFALDEVDDSLLHIYARHLKLPEDAIYVFFNGQTVFNRRFARYETSTSDECLYWFWRDRAKKIVFVISCFDL